MNVRKIVFSAVVAALYVVLTLVSMPIAYGAVQFRISEVLCILPFFFPFSVWGLVIGCIVANLFSPYLMPDIIVGPIASLLAALSTMYIGKMKSRDTILTKVFACFPPVIFNAVIIGAMIAFLMVGDNSADAFFPAFISSTLWVGLGQLTIMYVLGLPLMIYLPKTNVINKLKALYIEGENL